MIRRFSRSFVALVLLALVGPGRPDARAAELDCLVVPHEVVTVSTPVPGLIETVHAERGDVVKEGQVLVQLETSVKKAELATLRARAQMEARIKGSDARKAFGERRLKRTEELFRQEMVSTREMDEAETSKLLAEMELYEALEQRRLAELEVARVETELAMRTIKSPITGVVVDRFAATGEMAAQNPLFKLARIDPLRVETFVPIAMLGKVAVGIRLPVIPEGPFNGTHLARVSVVDRVGDAASGTFGVRLELPNPGYRLPAGIRCKVRFGG